MKQARDIRDQLVKMLERVEIDLSSDRNAVDNIKKCITSGFFYHCAKLQRNGSYRTVKNPQTVSIHPSSGLAKELPKWVVYFELVFTSKEYMRQCIFIQNLGSVHALCRTDFGNSCVPWLGTEARAKV